MTDIPLVVWAAIWIVFEIAVLIGFVFLGIVCFKRTKEQMYAEAGMFILSMEWMCNADS